MNLLVCQLTHLEKNNVCTVKMLFLMTHLYVQRGQKIFFLDKPGVAGKISLISLILAAMRSQNDKALALASSKIVVTLLPGGRSTLKKDLL